MRVRELSPAPSTAGRRPKKSLWTGSEESGILEVVEGMLRRQFKRIACLVVIGVFATNVMITPVSARLFQYQPLRERAGDLGCVSPLLLDMAWEEAIGRAMQMVREGVLPPAVLDRLLDARASGDRPFVHPDGCAQPVFEPFTAALIVGAVILGITLLVWAIAMAGSV